MKTLELKNYEVVSLKKEETIEMNGGLWLQVLQVYMFMLKYQDEIAEGFEEGFNKTYKGDDA